MQHTWMLSLSKVAEEWLHYYLHPVGPGSPPHQHWQILRKPMMCPIKSLATDNLHLMT